MATPNPLRAAESKLSDNEVEFDRLLNVKEAARQMGVSASFLNKARLTGDGPIFIKIGTRVSYDPKDLAAWLAERRRSSTAANHPAGDA